MKILLHGENLLASREELGKIKVNYQGEIISLSSQEINLEKIIQAVESLPILAEKRLIVLENFFSQSPKKENEAVFDYLIKTDNQLDIVLWEEKELKSAILKKLPAFWQVKLYKLPAVMFSFLESITPYQKDKAIKLIEQVRKKASDEFIYLMIVRQIRLLLLAKEKALPALPFWLSKRINFQASQFEKNQLLKLYQKLLVIDIKEKNNLTSLNLGEAIDLWLATL